MRGLVFKILILFGLLMPVTSAHAQSAREKLLAQPSRPTMEQVSELNKFRLKIPGFTRKPELDERVSLIQEHAPKIIAAIEAAFPDANLLFLGRDSAFLADIFEAHLMAKAKSQAQKKTNQRVIRLDASAQSFNGVDELDFLKSNGVRIGGNSLLPLENYVIIDATSWSDDPAIGIAQSRRLAEAVYSQVPEDLRSELYERFNAIGNGPSDTGVFNGVEITDGFDFAKFKNSIELTTTGPSKILYVPGTFASSGDELQWHGPFEEFERDSSGRVWAPPGEPSDMATRKIIVDSMIETAKIVTSRRFQKKVEEASLKIKGPPQKIVKEKAEKSSAADPKSGSAAKALRNAGYASEMLKILEEKKREGSRESMLELDQLLVTFASKFAAKKPSREQMERYFSLCQSINPIIVIKDGVVYNAGYPSEIINALEAKVPVNSLEYDRELDRLLATYANKFAKMSPDRGQVERFVAIAKSASAIIPIRNALLYQAGYASRMLSALEAKTDISSLEYFTEISKLTASYQSKFDRLAPSNDQKERYKEVTAQAQRCAAQVQSARSP